jgi:hypothetical protein
MKIYLTMGYSYVVFRIIIFLLITIAFSCSKDANQSGDETVSCGYVPSNTIPAL